ncbi:MAG: toxin ParE1/3/4 [Candidatus Omnitrophota bacterium]|jgi:toxin ParE1/3/4
MLKVFRTKQAQLDLIEIWIYIAEDNTVAADNFLFKLEAEVNLIASSPKIGRSRNELAKNLRSFPVGNYTIFYKQQVNALVLIRVIHSARDINNLSNLKIQ